MFKTKKPYEKYTFLTTDLHKVCMIHQLNKQSKIRHLKVGDRITFTSFYKVGCTYGGGYCETKEFEKVFKEKECIIFENKKAYKIKINNYKRNIDRFTMYTCDFEGTVIEKLDTSLMKNI